MANRSTVDENFVSRVIFSIDLHVASSKFFAKFEIHVHFAKVWQNGERRRISCFPFFSSLMFVATLKRYRLITKYYLLRDHGTCKNDQKLRFLSSISKFFSLQLRSAEVDRDPRRERQDDRVRKENFLSVTCAHSPADGVRSENGKTSNPINYSSWDAIERFPGNSPMTYEFHTRPHSFRWS